MNATTRTLIVICSVILVLGISAVIVAMAANPATPDARAGVDRDRDHDDDEGSAAGNDAPSGDLLIGDDNEPTQPAPQPNPVNADPGDPNEPTVPAKPLADGVETVIAGHVLDANTGDPIAGAEVRVWGGFDLEDGWGLEEGRWYPHGRGLEQAIPQEQSSALPPTGDDHARRIEDVQRTRVELEALKEALKLEADAMRQRELEAHARRALEDAEQQEQQRSSSRRHPAHGDRPMPGSWAEAEIKTHTTDADGAFHIVVPQGGNWQVQVTASGYAQWFQEVTVSAGETADLTIRLNVAFALHGVVSGPDGVVAGAQIGAVTWPPSQEGTASSGISAEDGTYRVEGLPDGQYLITVSTAGHFPFYEVVSVRGETKYDIALERGAVVSIHCTMKNGADVIPSLIASMVRQQESGALPTRELPGGINGKPFTWTLGSTMHSQAINAEGVIKIGGVAAGVYEITVYESANAIIPWKTRLTVHENGRHDVDALIDPGVQVRVNVIDEQGKGVPQAQVTFYTPNRYGDQHSRYATTDETGKTTISGLTERQYAVLAIATGFTNTEAEYDARSGGGDLELVMEKGNVLYGTLTAPGGTPIANAAIYLTGNESVRHGGHHAGQTDANGEYRIENVEEGTWTVTISAQGVVPSAEPLTVTIAKGENQFDVELGTDGNTLSGVVTMPDGAPAVGAHVIVQALADGNGNGNGNGRRGRNPRRGQHGQTTTDETGAWVIYGLQDGSVVVNVMQQQQRSDALFRDDANPRAYMVTLSAFESVSLFSDTTCDLRLVEPALLTGVMIDSTTGEPATGCYARLEAAGDRDPYDQYGRAGQSLINSGDGKFAFAAAPGDWTLVITRTGGQYDEIREPVRIPSRDLVIHLPAPPSFHAVSGTLLDQNNNPIVGAYLMLNATGDDKNPNPRMRAQAVTDQDGNFSLPQVREGAWRITAMTNAGSPIGTGWDLTVRGDVTGLILTGTIPPPGFNVMSVGADSNAANAGMKVGDVITEYNGAEVTDRDTLVAAIRAAEQGGSGGTLAVVVYRDGSYLTLYVNPGFLGISGH